MEWIDVVKEMISNGLFPIVVCGGLFWALITLFKSYEKVQKDTSDVIKSNTEAMTKLCEEIRYISEKGD